MNPLKKFWSALEDLPGGAASLMEWRFRLGADLDGAKFLLTPTGKHVKSLPTADDPYVRYRVVEHGPDDIIGIRDDDGTEIQLAKQDIRVYRLNRRHLARTITTAFNWDAADDPVDGVPHTSRIGTYRPVAGYVFPVYLTIPAEPAELLHAVDVISGRTGTPFIVMAPTVRRLQPEGERVLRTCRSCFLALAECITCDSTGQWVAAPAAKQRLAAFQQGVIPQETEAPHDHTESAGARPDKPPPGVDTESAPATTNHGRASGLVMPQLEPGDILIRGGDGGPDGPGRNVFIVGGNGGPDSPGGAVIIQASSGRRVENPAAAKITVVRPDGSPESQTRLAADKDAQPQDDTSAAGPTCREAGSMVPDSLLTDFHDAWTRHSNTQFSIVAYAGDRDRPNDCLGFVRLPPQEKCSKQEWFWLCLRSIDTRDTGDGNTAASEFERLAARAHKYLSREHIRSLAQSQGDLLEPAAAWCLALLQLSLDRGRIKESDLWKQADSVSHCVEVVPEWYKPYAASYDLLKCLTEQERRNAAGGAELGGARPQEPKQGDGQAIGADDCLSAPAAPSLTDPVAEQRVGATSPEDAAVRFTELARKLKRYWPKWAKNGVNARRKAFAVYGTRAGRAIWPAIEAGQLVITAAVRDEAAGWAGDGCWHEVFLVIMQRWLHTVRPELGGPSMSYPDADLEPGTKVGPTAKLAKAYFLAFKAIAKLLRDAGNPLPIPDATPTAVLTRRDERRGPSPDVVAQLAADLLRWLDTRADRNGMPPACVGTFTKLANPLRVAYFECDSLPHDAREGYAILRDAVGWNDDTYLYAARPTRADLPEWMRY